MVETTAPSPNPGPSGRRLFLWALALVVGALCLLPVDAAASRWLHGFHDHWLHTPVGTWARVVEGFGKGDVEVFLLLVAGAAGQRRRAALALASLLLVGPVVSVTKSCVGRERPDGTNARSFPSGDAAGIAAAAVSFAPLVTVPGTAILLTSVAGLRVYEGSHYPSDVLVGLALGLAAAGVVQRWLPDALWRSLRRRHFLAAIAIGGALYAGLGGGDTHAGFLRFLGVWAPVLGGLLLLSFRRALAARFGPWLRRVSPRRSTALVAALVVLVTLLAISTRSTLWDRDEPRYARAAMEMVSTGDFLVPHFNGELRPDKPALIYWLMSVPVRLLGPREIAVRAWAAVALAATLLLTWRLGRRLLSPRAGLLAGLVLVTTPLAVITGSAATTDAVLLAFITLAISTFADAFLDGWRPRHGLWIALALAGALLTKGPVGWVIPLASMATIAWLGRRESPLTWRHAGVLAVAAGLAIAAFLAWGVPANRATGGELARQGLGHHVLQRSLEPLESHGGNLLSSLPYYPLTLLLTFFPWTLHLGGGISALLGGRLGGSRGRAVLLGWMLPTLLLMTAVATKLPHYLLPIWPALALVVAGVLRGAVRGELAPRDLRWLRRGMGWTAAGGLLLTLGLVLIPQWLPRTEEPWGFLAAALVMAATTVVALHAHRAGRWERSFAVLLGGTWITGATLLLSVLPAIEALKVSAPVAALIRAQTPLETPVAQYGYGEPSLVFYLQRGPVRRLDSREEVISWAEEPGAGVLVLPEAEWQRLQDRALPLRLLGARAGYNFAKGKPVNLAILERGRPE